MNIKVRYSTQEACIKYCKKDGDCVERGRPRIQSERIDLFDAKERIKNGEEVSSIVDDHRVTQGDLRVLNYYKSYLAPRKREKPIVY
jgi:uncharacterized protein (DUF433 family)